jgi:hypothetical protein
VCPKASGTQRRVFMKNIRTLLITAALLPLSTVMGQQTTIPQTQGTGQQVQGTRLEDDPAFQRLSPEQQVHNGPGGLRPLPPRWAFAARFRPATPTTAAAARDGAHEGAPSAGRVGETPVASDRLNVRPGPPPDQYLRIKSRACLQRRSRSRTRSNARRHAGEQKCCKGLRRARTNPS